ncbi:MAG TPA: ABC transporter permease [Candidatus Kapabacteria bacterium]|nr:ABC transporter permease [Candidatus Kapabacteria bacterium]
MIVLIATAGVAVGVAALIITLAILAGFEKTLTENVVRYTAHARVAVYGGRPIPDFRSTEAHLRRRVPEIVEVTPFVQREAVLRSPTTVAGVLLKGITPNDTAIVNRNTIIAGGDLTSAKGDTLQPIVLSEGLAKELNTEVGKALTAIRFHENITSREQLLDNISRFRVVGVFRTGMSEYDNLHAFTTLEAAQQFVGFNPRQASGFNIMTHSLADVPKLTRDVGETLRYPYYVESVYDIGQTIFAWIELQKEPIPIILGLIIIVATFNVISTLLLIVIEKTHSIGVLKALGATNGGVAKIFITEGLVIGVIGTLMGNIIAFALSYLEAKYHFFKLKSDIYFMSSVPVSIEWEHYAAVSAIALVLALTATLIPARIAARMRPLHALRFG